VLGRCGLTAAPLPPGSPPVAASRTATQLASACAPQPGQGGGPAGSGPSGQEICYQTHELAAWRRLRAAARHQRCASWTSGWVGQKGSEMQGSCSRKRLRYLCIASRCKFKLCQQIRDPHYMVPRAHAYAAIAFPLSFPPIC
jgi:hypothetical protein